MSPRMFYAECRMGCVFFELCDGNSPILTFCKSLLMFCICCSSMPRRIRISAILSLFYYSIMSFTFILSCFLWRMFWIWLFCFEISSSRIWSSWSFCISIFSISLVSSFSFYERSCRSFCSFSSLFIRYAFYIYK